MNTHRYLIAAAFVVIAVVLSGTNAQAQLLEEKIYVTFSNSVEVPGYMLPAGTYVFESLEGGVLTRILNADETHVYATLFTVPDERRDPMDDAKVILRESPEKTNERVDEWFYPGMSVGHEFTYPREHSRKATASTIGFFPRETARATKATAKGVAHSSKFVAVHADHIVAGTIGHGLKALV
jgi:hypothetical protein